MRFDGEDRSEVLLSDQRHKLPEGEIPFSDRQVLIGRAVVVMDMDLTQAVAEYLQPFPERRPPEGIGVPGIETESNPGRIQRVEKRPELQGPPLIDVLHGDQRLGPFNVLDQPVPCFETVGEPLPLPGNIVLFIE